MLFVLIYYILISGGFGENTHQMNEAGEFDFGSLQWDPCKLKNGIYDIYRFDRDKSVSFKITKTDAKIEGHYSIEIPTERELKTHSKLNLVAGNIEFINGNIGKHLFIDGRGIDLGTMMIKIERVGNIYKLICDLAPASGGGGISGCGSHKQRMNTRRRRRRTYQKKRVSSKRYRRRSARSRASGRKN